jgi:cation:H+ antiporter
MPEGWLTLVQAVGGLGLVLFSAERLVGAVVGAAVSLGMSTFVVSVLFVGFDPENLAVGAAAAHEGIAGFALGSVVGAAMVAVALAFGLTAILSPMEFVQVPRQVVVLPVLAVLMLGALCLDGELSRVDGTLLLLGFGVAVAWLILLTRRGLDIVPAGEVAEALERPDARSRWRALGLLLSSLAGIVVGSELLVSAAADVMHRLELSDTTFGMTVLALVVSVEELARELPAAFRGRPEITFGNVVGSVLAFFLFNAGLIALVRPVTVSPLVIGYYLPVCLGTVALTGALMRRRRVGRAAGILLLLCYLVFVAGG